MAEPIELEAADLAAMLCSRLCHDLINPISAVTNGVYSLEDPSQAGMGDLAHNLIASGSRQAQAKLEYARIAFGAASAAGSDIETRECERVAKLLFDTEKPELDWAAPPLMLPKNKAKLLMNMLTIAIGAVPRGGVIKVEVTGEAGAEVLTLTAGLDPADPRQRVIMPPDLENLLAGRPSEEISARLIQPYYTGLLARLSGMTLEVGVAEDKFTFVASPAAA